MLEEILQELVLFTLLNGNTPRIEIGLWLISHHMDALVFQNKSSLNQDACEWCRWRQQTGHREPSVAKLKAPVGVLISGRVSSRWRCWWLRPLTAEFSCCVQVKRGRPQCSWCFLLKYQTVLPCSPPAASPSDWKPKLNTTPGQSPACAAPSDPPPWSWFLSWFAKAAAEPPRSHWRCCSPG